MTTGDAADHWMSDPAWVIAPSGVGGFVVSCTCGWSSGRLPDGWKPTRWVRSRVVASWRIPRHPRCTVVLNVGNASPVCRPANALEYIASTATRSTCDRTPAVNRLRVADVDSWAYSQRRPRAACSRGFVCTGLRQIRRKLLEHAVRRAQLLEGDLVAHLVVGGAAMQSEYRGAPSLRPEDDAHLMRVLAIAPTASLVTG